MPLEEVERRYILRAVDALGGNKTLAAQILGLDRKTLYRKLDNYRDDHEPPRLRDTIRAVPQRQNAPWGRNGTDFGGR